MENPFLDRSVSGTWLSACPTVCVIFGATGDLTHRKLVPALYNLSVDKLLPEKFALVGFARRGWKGEDFVESLDAALSRHSRRLPVDKEVWENFSSEIHYVCGSFDDVSAYEALAERLEAIDSRLGENCNRIFYLAVSPDFFFPICSRLKSAGLLRDKSGGDRCGGKVRVVVEKPFGHDLESARDLNRKLLECMAEDKIYRIDHYLGKETVQNLLVFRFANGIFEPVWNRKYVSHVEISVCESIGVGSRAGYFDKAGMLRDVVQNHVLQLLCLTALEPPSAFSARAIRDEKVKVLRAVRRFQSDCLCNRVVRGRYIGGYVNGTEVPGYLEEEGVARGSTTETYVALEFGIDNWRWAGVPFFLRAGKRLAKRVTDISIHFKQVPFQLFSKEGISSVPSNVLSFQIQPDEGISIRISSKPPGPSVRVQGVKMEFSYGLSFGMEPPEAYERLLLDAMRGDATLFTRDDEIEEAWDILQPVIDLWSGGSASDCRIADYEAGTWGPSSAAELLKRRGVAGGWRRL